MVAETKEELAKCTIPQLKERLKHRRLAISGSKADLINRLYESLQEEEILGGDATNVNTSELDVDALLGNNDSVNPDIDSKDELILLGIDKEEEKKTTQHPTGKPVEKPVHADSTSSQIENDKSDGKPKKERPQISAPEVVVKETKATTIEDAKAKRAARFGTDVKQESEAPKPKEATGNGTEKKPEIKTSDPKLLARAKRFGLPVSDGPSPAKTVKTFDEDEKLKARRLRFGL